MFFKTLVLTAFAGAAHAAQTKAEVRASVSAKLETAVAAHTASQAKLATATRSYIDGCNDTNNGAGDTYGDACDWYDNNSSWGCGGYWDWSGFNAGSMCCACGGGEYPPAACEDTNNGYGDTYGDACDWYDNNADWGCGGSWDWASFTAGEMCCACGGGTDYEPPAAPACEDTSSGVGDTYGDDCDWYEYYGYGSWVCDGYWDWSEFVASEHCCTCGGGTDFQPPAMPEAAGCEDTSNGLGDTYGDDCDWYEGYGYGSWVCDGYWDWADFTASIHCCTCGGGTDYVEYVMECYDSNNGAGDTYGDACDWYDNNADWGCGGYWDWSGFNAGTMCCACGGGNFM